MNIQVNEALRAYIDPLTADEHAALERSLLSEGCRDALVLWGEVLVDGHNRHAICLKHDIPFQTVQHAGLHSMDDVHLWMIDQHLGRRSVSDFQRGVLALRKKDIESARVKTPSPDSPADTPKAAGAPAMATRDDIARAARLSPNTVGQIEKIQKSATPELVAAVRSGTISINAAAAVASLPSEQQVQAVAGGKKEMQQAARLVRESKAHARLMPVAVEGDDPEAAPAASDEPPTIETLQAENAALRKKIVQLTIALSEARRVS
ncbi:MAG: hypothetical protein RLZZ618_4041 [Pseudomonadota bacterium]|jgi:hypothetical protein